MLNLLGLLTILTKIDTNLTAAQQVASLALSTASEVADLAGKTDTAAHIDTINDAIKKDAALAAALLHVFTKHQTPQQLPVVNNGGDAS